MSERIPLFLVEDQTATLKALVKLLGSYPAFEVVGTAMTGEAARHALPLSGARVALVDIELPGIDGIELVALLKSAHVQCELLMLTSFADPQKLFEAMRRGASGYLVKGVAADKLARAIEEVDGGGTIIEPRLAKHFWQYFKGVEEPRRNETPLDAEELDLLTLVAKGLSNAETAGVLGLGKRNVRTRLGKIYDKLGARSHVDAVVVALKRGLIEI